MKNNGLSNIGSFENFNFGIITSMSTFNKYIQIKNEIKKKDIKNLKSLEKKLKNRG